MRRGEGKASRREFATLVLRESETEFGRSKASLGLIGCIGRALTQIIRAFVYITTCAWE